MLTKTFAQCKFFLQGKHCVQLLLWHWTFSFLSTSICVASLTNWKR